jgi:hypothetical protein
LHGVLGIRHAMIVSRVIVLQASFGAPQMPPWIMLR